MQTSIAMNDPKSSQLLNYIPVSDSFVRRSGSRGGSACGKCLAKEWESDWSDNQQRAGQM